MHPLRPHLNSPSSEEPSLTSYKHTHTHTHKKSSPLGSLAPHVDASSSSLATLQVEELILWGSPLDHQCLAWRDVGGRCSFFLSLSFAHSCSLSPSLSLFHFFYNFKQNRLKKSPQIWEKLIVSRQTLKNFLRTPPEQRTVKIPKSSIQDWKAL